MANLRGAILGTGFWSNYRIPAWNEVGGVDIVACWNRTHSRAEVVAHRFNITRVYADVEELFRSEPLDFVDIITAAPAHLALIKMAATYKVPVICQAPLAPDYNTAKQIVDLCGSAGIPLYVHENRRWSYPVRQLKRLTDEGHIGRIVRGHFASVHFLDQAAWDNDPHHARHDKLILAEQGDHLYDLARFFFGEFDTVYAHKLSVRNASSGDDVASSLLTKPGAIVSVEFSCSTYPVPDCCAGETICLEGTDGTLTLDSDHWIQQTTAQGATKTHYPPPEYSWCHPEFLLSHSSMVPIHQDFVRGLRGEGSPETTGADNLKTLELAHLANASARTGQAIDLHALARMRQKSEARTRW